MKPKRIFPTLLATKSLSAWRYVLPAVMAAFAGCTGQLTEDEASAAVRYMPFAIVVPKGEELRNAENYAASHPGHEAVWATADRPLPHYGSAAAMVLKDIPYGELQRGMIVVYLTRMGVRAGGILVAKEREGWLVKDWGSEAVKDRYLKPSDVIGVVVLVFVGRDSDARLDSVTPLPVS